jgi:hypothetical protein
MYRVNPRTSPGNIGVVVAYLLEDVAWYVMLQSARMGATVAGHLHSVDLPMSAFVSLFFS